jgi:small subunit ribosomal protein S11
MGKKRIVKKGNEDSAQKNSASSKKLSKKRLETAILYVQSTFNNTKLLLTDEKGNSICNASSGSLGFKGAKKGTPFAAAKAAETLLEKIEQIGIKKINVVVRGIGAGRESSIRAFISKGIQILSIVDRTPVPHNGPKPKKPRRV